MRQRLLIILLFCFMICYSQTYKSSFGSYTLVTEQDMPFYIGSIENNGTYNRAEAYNQYYSTTYGSSGPMKAPGDKWSGSSTETVDGQTVIVYWTVSATGMGIVLWTITYTYPDGHTETESYIGSPGNAKNHAQEEAHEKARELAEEWAHAFPLGDAYIILLFVIAYFIVIKCRQHKQVASFCL